MLPLEPGWRRVVHARPMMSATSTIEARRASIEAVLASFRSGQERLAWMVDQARRAAPLPPACRVPTNQVEGCLAKLWISCHYREGRCFYACDSDSLVTKALALVLCELHSGCTPAEILTSDPSFLAPLGITQHLTPNRRNALSRVVERLQRFATSSLAAEANSQ